MNKIRPGLGRGLDALINPQTQDDLNKPVDITNPNLQSDDGSSQDILVKIEIENIKPNPYQPRAEFDPKSLDELKNSILLNGLIQPITVRRSGDGHYELISGERRLRACKDIGFSTIPAYIIVVDTKEAMVALALIENIQREKLNPIEIAYAYKRLIDECNLSQEQVSEKVGKDRTTITNSLRLLKLPKNIQDSIIKDEISSGHARALINVDDETHQTNILNKIIKENLSVRKVEQLVRNLNTEKKEKRIKEKSVDDKELVSQRDVENKLRNIFGTKVTCRQKKDGAGHITIDFYSNDEFERLFELFDLIEKSNY